VFISSVIAGFQPFRDAASRAARTLRHEVIKAEDLGAAPESPQRLCLAGVRKADVVVLILGARYGEIQASGLFRKDAADTADDGLVERAEALVPREHAFASPSLALIVVGGPRQQVIRPVDTRDVAFSMGAQIEDAFGSKSRRFKAYRGEFAGEFDRRRYGWG
jgi:hypothetical protein